MIEFYAGNTPHGQEVAIMLEIAERAYTIHLVNLDDAELLPSEFLALSPNGKLPTLVDSEAKGDPITIMETDAILQHLADQAGRLLPAAGPDRLAVLKWLDWQIDELSPPIRQLHHALNTARAVGEDGAKGFTDEVARLIGVLDNQLAETLHIAGAALSIADIAIYPHVFQVHQELKNAVGETWRHVELWQERMARRPAVGRGMAAIG